MYAGAIKTQRVNWISCAAEGFRFIQDMLHNLISVAEYVIFLCIKCSYTNLRDTYRDKPTILSTSVDIKPEIKNLKQTHNMIQTHAMKNVYWSFTVNALQYVTNICMPYRNLRKLFSCIVDQCICELSMCPADAQWAITGNDAWKLNWWTLLSSCLPTIQVISVYLSYCNRDI